MPKMDEFERGILASYDKGRLKSVASKSGLAKFRTASRATALKDRRIRANCELIESQPLCRHRDERSEEAIHQAFARRLRLAKGAKNPGFSV